MSSGYPMTGTVVVAVNKLYSIYAHFQSADQNTSKTADKKKKVYMQQQPVSVCVKSYC